ncbi:hypothetical protein Moror_1323 [Moniliophthora roreri MCA 2997]|uniref:Uncharacterized protein n=1 Tax=Moniliophthora roreri (strain MCA 2997) TaxID=1381753 RepID=V2WL32_MONRO|nr:hypothetical protein Moror_1323 [Moniliophthora roreri MCA 2997]
MVDGSEVPHFKGHTIENEAGLSNSTANARPSSATPHAASPTNTVNSTNEASAVVADNANPSLPPSKLVDMPQPMSLLTPSSTLDSIMFFSLPHLLTAPESDDEDKVLYTLPT